MNKVWLASTVLEPVATTARPAKIDSFGLYRSSKEESHLLVSAQVLME